MQWCRPRGAVAPAHMEAADVVTRTEDHSGAQGERLVRVELAPDRPFTSGLQMAVPPRLPPSAGWVWSGLLLHSADSSLTGATCQWR